MTSAVEGRRGQDILKKKKMPSIPRFHRARVSVLLTDCDKQLNLLGVSLPRRYLVQHKHAIVSLEGSRKAKGGVSSGTL